MTKSFEAITSDAETLYDKIRDEDRAHAVLTIAKALIELTAEVQNEVLDEVQERFAIKS